MADLCGAVGELRMTLQITRKETGKVETVELVGTVMDEAPEGDKEKGDGGNS